MLARLCYQSTLFALLTGFWELLKKKLFVNIHANINKAVFTFEGVVKYIHISYMRIHIY
jgi:hypothetical protein